MKNIHFIKYYRVFKNDTAVTEISVNDFKPVKSLPIINNDDVPSYFFPPDERMFYGYPDKAHAMEKAKSGALAHIDRIIQEVETGLKKLIKYRNDHYEDLNINLLDAHISRLKKEIHSK